jgi:hypothetical protein
VACNATRLGAFGCVGTLLSRQAPVAAAVDDGAVESATTALTVDEEG